MRHVTARLLAPALAAAVVASWLVPAPAWGQAADPKQQAKEHGDKGTRLYEIGKYAEAITEYEKAYELGGDARLLYNIAQAYRLADQPENAVRAYRAYLRRDPGSKLVATVEKRIAELEKAIEERRRPPESGAQAPAAAAGSPPAAPPTGPTTQPTPALGAQPTSTPPTVGAEGSTAEGGVQGGSTPLAPAEPAVGQTQAPPTVTAPAPAPRSSLARKIISYSLMGGGGLLLAVSLVQADRARDQAKIIADGSVNDEPFDPDVEKAGKAASSIAVATGILAVVSAGAGVALLLTAPKPTRAASGASTYARRPTLIPIPIAGAGILGGGAAVRF